MTLTQGVLATPSRSAYVPRGGRAWRAAAWLAVLVATAAHVWVARSAFGKGFPTLNYDEIDTLMAGRAAVGVTSPQVSGAGYFPLSSVLVSPAWWFTSDSYVVYRIAIAVGVLLALATIWPLARLARRFGLTTAQAVTVAGVVMALPARTLQADYAIAEKTLFLLLALALLAAVRLGERPTPARGAVFGLLVALSYFCHARFLVVVAVAAVWLVLFALPLDRRRWPAALTGLATLLPLAWGLGRLAVHINGLVDSAGFEQSEHILDNLAVGNTDMILRAGLGQAWEQVVSTFGLAAVGLVVAVARARREVRLRQLGPASLLLGTAFALLGGSVLVWASSDWLFSTGWLRLDAWIYGRYADPAFALLALVGLSAIVRGVGRATVAASVLVALGVAVPTLLWLAPQAPTGAYITPVHIPGAMAWWWALPTGDEVPGSLPTLTNGNRFWLLATLTAAAPLAVLAAAARRPRLRALLVAGLVLLLGGAGSVLADQASGHYQRDHQVISALVAELRPILAEHPGTTVGYREECPEPVSQGGGRRNRFMWQLLPTIVSRSTDGVDIAIACDEAAGSLPPGGARLASSAFDDRIHAWVMPGPLQDELRVEGVLPPGE